jgi:transposase
MTKECRRASARMSDADPAIRGVGGGGLRHRPTLRQDLSREHSSQSATAYVPLSFAPGEAYQFDWSHEIVVMSSVTTTLKVAHVRLCHSRRMFVRAYPRETQEMVFDAHDRAFAFFKGACTRGIYDSMKTAVDTIFVGKDRQYNRRHRQVNESGVGKRLKVGHADFP